MGEATTDTPSPPLASDNPHYLSLVIAAVAVGELGITERVLPLLGVSREQFEEDCFSQLEAWRAREQAVYDEYQASR